jgi:Family of unknown function (DUF6174)
MGTSRRTTRAARGAGIAATGVAALGLLWVLSDARAAGAAHDQALARWEVREPQAYSFVYGHCSGVCAPCPVRITVRDGEVTDTVVRGEGCGRPAVEHAPTIEDVFAVAERRRTGVLDALDDASTSITYDPEWGFPSRITVTCPGPDCNAGWSVTEFDVESG